MATLARLAEIDVERVSGLAGRRGTTLKTAGIATVADLLMHVPRRYIDRSRIVPIGLLPVGQEVTVIARVLSVSSRQPRRKLMIVEAQLTDGTERLSAIWFNQRFRLSQLREGMEVALSGKVDRYKAGFQMKSPEVDVLSGDTESLTTGRVVPVYPNVKDVGIGWIRRAMHNALQRSLPMPDPVPEAIVRRHRLVDRSTAFQDIHFPEDMSSVRPARTRLAFDELFRLEVALAVNKRRMERESKGVAHRPSGELVGRFIAGLPYPLTDAQHRVLAEITDDLGDSKAMHRLLQGEVGSGKTVVAVATLLTGVEGGWQGAVMAPTEVLAVQHFLGIRDLLEEAGMAPDQEGHGEALGMSSLFAAESGDGPVVTLALLTGSQAATNHGPAVTREQVLAAIADGSIDIVVGTHALIQEGVHFRALGVAVVDEQHRFGALQRVTLREKGVEADPDLLIMTATPIPRTLSMTLYGDLDVSVIDEMPPGRSPVDTVALGREREEQAWELVRAEVAAGRQAFVVCPLVDDSEKVEAASATAEYDRLRSVFPGLRLGLIHGQLPPRDKDRVMHAFRDGELDLLVATTVIEVGIDIPNATVIVVEDADRFGLSQLHQLRGRVGRGRHPGTCVLLADPTTDDGQARITAMVETTDGFRLAEEDLRIRGQGTVFGARQSGMGDLRVADILADFDLLVAARDEAFALVDSDPDLGDHRDLAEEVARLLGDEVAWLFVS
jgi:ATP-dependent DNA helicase RecG